MHVKSEQVKTETASVYRECRKDLDLKTGQGRAVRDGAAFQMTQLHHTRQFVAHEAGYMRTYHKDRQQNTRMSTSLCLCWSHSHDKTSMSECKHEIAKTQNRA